MYTIFDVINHRIVLKYTYLIGENFVGGNFRRLKCFVGGNVSSVEIFVGGNVSPVETFRRWKCFVGGNFVTWPNFRHFPPTIFSPIRYTIFHMIFSIRMFLFLIYAQKWILTRKEVAAAAMIIAMC